MWAPSFWPRAERSGFRSRWITSRWTARAPRCQGTQDLWIRCALGCPLSPIPQNFVFAKKKSNTLTRTAWRRNAMPAQRARAAPAEAREHEPASVLPGYPESLSPCLASAVCHLFVGVGVRCILEQSLSFSLAAHGKCPSCLPVPWNEGPFPRRVQHRPRLVLSCEQILPCSPRTSICFPAVLFPFQKHPPNSRKTPCFLRKSLLKA